MSELATLLPNVPPSPVHRIANSPAAKSLWQSLPTVSKKLRRILFRGLFLRVDLSKIDRTPLPRSHFFTNKKRPSLGTPRTKSLHPIRHPCPLHLLRSTPAPLVRRETQGQAATRGRLRPPQRCPTRSYFRFLRRPIHCTFATPTAPLDDIYRSSVRLPPRPIVPQPSGSILHPLPRCHLLFSSHDIRSQRRTTYLVRDIKSRSRLPSPPRHSPTILYGRYHTRRIYKALSPLAQPHAHSSSYCLRFSHQPREVRSPTHKATSSSRLSDRLKPLHFPYTTRQSSRYLLLLPHRRTTSTHTPDHSYVTARQNHGTSDCLTPTRRYTWSLIHELTSAIPSTRARRSQLRQHRISLSPLVRSDLLWIASNLRTFPPASFSPRATHHLYTDASLHGWGAWCPQLQLATRGRWTAPILPHIQILEMSSVLHAISQLPFPPYSRIVLHTDNTSVLSYLTRWGGSNCPRLHRLSHRLWDLLLARQITLISTHYIPSRLNTTADRLSRST